ncbi:MAG: ORC1-type DNA replication protein 1 [Nitrosopumilus sp.]|nr:ORC1-type DNA replication protein 1 [Nitrosopumilus sp.]
MDLDDIKKFGDQLDKENEIFADKSALDTLSTEPPKSLKGRESESREFMTHLYGFKKGKVPSLISVYGRSGAGKSAIIKYVCANLDFVKPLYVNLRETKTVFGAAQLMLLNISNEHVKNSQGITVVMRQLREALKKYFKSNDLFVLILDEFDSIFHDTRGSPSDLIYKLVEIQSELLRFKKQICIVTISNNVLSDYDLDDRVRSRIGNSEVFFKPYGKGEILEIIKARAQLALNRRVSNDVLEYIARLCTLEHGDARRAVDLLRICAELAGKDDSVIKKKHVDEATKSLQVDRIALFLQTTSLHVKLILLALAKRTYGTDEEWHATAVLFDRYSELVPSGIHPVEYRRFSQILVEIENYGFIFSRTGSGGRRGYHTKFRLDVSPTIVGETINKEWWDKNAVQQKAGVSNVNKIINDAKHSTTMPGLLRKLKEHQEGKW